MFKKFQKSGGSCFRVGAGTEGAFFLVPLCVVSISNLSSWSKLTAEAPATVSSFQMAGKRKKLLPVILWLSRIISNSLLFLLGVLCGWSYYCKNPNFIPFLLILPFNFFILLLQILFCQPGLSISFEQLWQTCLDPTLKWNVLKLIH